MTIVNDITIEVNEPTNGGGAYIGSFPVGDLVRVT